MTQFESLVHSIDPVGQLLRAWPLTGGVSAQVTALEVLRGDGQTQTMVVRQHGDIDRQRNPNIAQDEFKLLEILQSVGVAAPQPYFANSELIVVEFIDGQPDFAPANLPDFLRQMAAQLARIHQVAPPTFLPRLDDACTQKLRERPTVLDDSLDEGRIRDALEVVWPLKPLNAACLLHGDFWPGNVLWQYGQLAAVIDWEDAQVGDPLADVANARLEILWSLGKDAMQQFTQAYQALTEIDFAHLPFWDLFAALRPAGKLGTWGLDKSVEQNMRELHREFVEAAIAQKSF